MHPFRSIPCSSLSMLAAASLLVACAPSSGSADELLVLRSAASTLDPLTVSLGQSTTCATTLDGLAKCWGRGDAGRLGQGQPLADRVPDPFSLAPLELGGEATAVVTNGAQSFALLDDGTVRGFGLNAKHELGTGHARTVGDDETPASTDAVVPLAGPALQLAAGDGFACARLVDGRVQCWGRDDHGQLGRDQAPADPRPADVLLGAPAAQITAGTSHACALTPAGAVRCWGRSDMGQLGRGPQVPGGVAPTGAGEVSLGGVAVEVVAGGAHTCARMDTGAIRCWGDDTHGQLGYGPTAPVGDDEVPADASLVPLDAAAVQVVAGLRHACARLEDGTLRCWGDDALGQLGLALPPPGSVVDPSPGPRAVDLDGAEAQAVYAGPLAMHTCAQLDDGGLKCWGANAHGQLGLGFVAPLDPVEGPPGDLPDVIIVEDPDV